MAWPYKEPGHQLPWYWPKYPRIFDFQHQKIHWVAIYYTTTSSAFNVLRLEQNGKHFGDIFFECIFLEFFFFSFDSNFTGLFPTAQLTVDKHWFRYWLGTEQVTSHYLNQQWSSSLSDLLAILAGLNELILENIWIFRNFHPLEIDWW